MCCCKKPTINGEPGYSWDGKTVSIYKPNPPALIDGDELLADEPGRCGGIDSHCHHFRLVRRLGQLYLLVRHGGGDESLRLGNRPGDLLGLKSNPRYWLLQMLYHVQDSSARAASLREESLWRKAAAEKRIKTRKFRGGVKVWIEPVK